MKHYIILSVLVVFTKARPNVGPPPGTPTEPAGTPELDLEFPDPCAPGGPIDPDCPFPPPPQIPQKSGKGTRVTGRLTLSPPLENTKQKTCLRMVAQENVQCFDCDIPFLGEQTILDPTI